MPLGFKRAIEIMKQSGRETEEDRKFQADFKSSGQAGLQPHIAALSHVLLQEFEPADADALRLQTDVYADRKRPYATFASFGVRYDITNVPHADRGQARIWEVVASLKDRRLSRDQFPIGQLRQGLIGLMSAYSPEGVDMGGNLPGPRQMPDPVTDCPQQSAYEQAGAFCRRIADDYWFAVDILVGRVSDDQAAAQHWLDWLCQYAVLEADAYAAMVQNGFAPSTLLQTGILGDDDITEPPLWVSWTITHAVMWWTGRDQVIGMANKTVEHPYFVVPVDAQVDMPAVDTQ